MATRKKTQAEIEAEEEELLQEELDDTWEDDGAESPGAKLLRRFGEIRKRILWTMGRRLSSRIL